MHAICPFSYKILQGEADSCKKSTCKNFCMELSLARTFCKMHDLAKFVSFFLQDPVLQGL